MAAASSVPLSEAKPGRRPRKPPIAAADLAHCRDLLAGGSRTFLAASYLLPRSVRDPACALYAFCRVADDAIDHSPRERVDEALAGLRVRLDRIYEEPAAGAIGSVTMSAPDRAFAAVVHHFAIPRALPEALLEGFAWDAAGRRYETLAELQDYAARVAGTVGAMMALVMRVNAPAALARACDLGLAMQMSNIARDVGEDARAGRIYLPLAWLREAGLDVEAWLAAPRGDARVAVVVQRLLAHADELYAGVEAGIACLPASCRVGIDSARLLYAEIGREVARRGFDSVSTRAVVGRRRKLRLVWRAATTRARRGQHEGNALPATLGLVSAATSTPAKPTLQRPSPAATGNGRMVWVIELFARLETRQRLRYTAGST